ncbi:unnamed protein product [Acidithrix sp. C25]|nr:unnamed protein product [Acidithrix sp. C25]
MQGLSIKLFTATPKKFVFTIQWLVWIIHSERLGPLQSSVLHGATINTSSDHSKVKIE